MRAASFAGPRSIRMVEVPDARIEQPTDAVVRVVLAAICGTDLKGYRGTPVQPGPGAGHEFLGVVEAVGPEVRLVRKGRLVVAPFTWSDGDCPACLDGLSSSCRRGGMWGGQRPGAQAEAVRVPFADATLIDLPLFEDDERLPAVLALADVMATGTHAARSARITPGASVAVVGDGAVGLCAVSAAARMGAERIILLGHHPDRAPIGRALGATDHLGADDGDPRDHILELTEGRGADATLECAGTPEALRTAVAVTRDGGTVGAVGAPHPGGVDLTDRFLRNITLTGGLAPARTYLPTLLDDVLAGRLDPSPVFDLTVDLDHIAHGYQAMSDRTAIKALIRI